MENLKLFLENENKKKNKVEKLIEELKLKRFLVELNGIPYSFS